MLRPDVWGLSSSYKLPVPSLPELLTAGAYLTPQTGQPLVSPDKGQEILDHHPLEVTPSTMGTELQRGRGSSLGARAQQGARGWGCHVNRSCLGCQAWLGAKGTAEQQSLGSKSSLPGACSLPFSGPQLEITKYHRGRRGIALSTLWGCFENRMGP